MNKIHWTDYGLLILFMLGHILKGITGRDMTEFGVYVLVYFVFRILYVVTQILNNDSKKIG